MATTEQYLTALLQLPVAERAQIAHALLDSLDDEPPDPNAEANWIAEILRRMESIDDGNGMSIPLSRWDNA